MLTKLEIQNYKSICNASIELSPFTLLIGANGTGKSNLISLFEKLSLGMLNRSIMVHDNRHEVYSYEFQKHFQLLNEGQYIKLENLDGEELIIQGDHSIISPHKPSNPADKLPELLGVKIFRIDPSSPGKSESLISNPVVNENGTGVVQVLDSLKTGDREDLFVAIEKKFGEYIPEIEKLSFISGPNTKQLQVREKHISAPMPVEVLSEGTKLVLTILTILYQEHPPSLICIEDIDRGLHPRLFQQIIELCRDLSEKLGIQIIATTHNPYILDEFVGNESAVVIVEKKEGCTTFTTLSERLAQLEANGSDDEMPLGSLWYSGLVGGVPRR